MSAANVKANEPSMEEILASIRRIISDDQGKVEAAPEPPPAPEPTPEPEPEILDLATVAPVEDQDITFAEEPEPLLKMPKVEPPPPPPVAAAPEPPPPPPPPPPPRQPDPAPDRLLSADADTAVSSAFNALASTILTSNARTLEDLVKDMMRPMLKVWLDDNLPALVERLVRAEIERVSRGSRQ